MNLAAEGGFRLLFGPRFEEIVAAAFAQKDHHLSYESTVFAEAGGAIVGMASGYTAEQFQGFSKNVLRLVAGRSAGRVACASALISPKLRFTHMYEEGDFYIQFLAVDEACRGKGIGSALIKAMEAQARRSESVRFVIDVSARNDGARRLYERGGFVVHARWPRLRLLPPAILRMTRQL